MRHWRRAAILAAAMLALAGGGAAAWRLGYRPWAPAVVRRLPPAETLFYLDLRPLRAALPDLAGAPAGGSAYAAFVRASGFDYSRDLDQIALALRGDPAHPASACAILAGRFPARFRAYLNQHARHRVRVAGLAAWQFPGLARPRQTMTVAMPAPGLLVVSNASDPAPDLGRAASAWRAAPGLWRAAWWRPRPVGYLAADTLALAAERHLDGQRPPWEGARRMRVSLRLAPPGDLRLQAVERASDAPAAARTLAWLRQAAHALGAALRADPPAGAALAALLARVRWRRDGSRLRARLTLSPAELRAALAPEPGR